MSHDQFDDLSPWQPAPRWLSLAVDVLAFVVVGAAAYSVWGR